MKYLIVIVSLLWASGLFAQTDDVVYEYRKGKKFAVHIVQSGNTLWGLQETYKVPAKDIIAANPGSEKGIQDGQKLLIPMGAATEKYPEGTMILEHVVVKGETVYSLSKREGCTQEELLKMNPDAAGGLKIGQVVKIPVKALTEPVTATVQSAKPVETTVSFSDTVISHKVLDHETLYSISKRFMVSVEELQRVNKLKNTNIKPGQILQIPLKKEQVKQVAIRQVTQAEEVKKVDQELLFKKKEEYHIAVMLPFYLEGGESGYRGIATEFYMGMELAADSLEKLGFRAKIHVYDATNDSMSVVKLLRKPEMKEMDLIFAPLLPQGADIVGEWCKANKIRMVCPSACNGSLLKDNPYVYASVPTDITLLRILARYTLEKHAADQIVLVNTGVSRDQELYDAYRSRFMELSRSRGNVKLIEIKTDDLAGYIRKNGNTVFVVPTRDRAAAMKFMNALQKHGSKAGNGAISVFGTKDWASFDDIKGNVRNKYNIHWASANDLNYALPETKNLLRHYRIKFKADMSRFGAHGFDVMFFYARTLLMGQAGGEGVMNAFNPEPVAPGDGYENNQAYILKNVDYELTRVGLVHE